MITKRIFEVAPKITAILIAELIPQDVSSDEDTKIVAIENLIANDPEGIKSFFAKYKIGIATIEKFTLNGSKFISFITSSVVPLIQFDEEDSFSDSFDEAIKYSLSIAENILKEANEKDVFDAANALFVENGKTTSKEVKDYLRARGFFVNQKFVCT